MIRRSPFRRTRGRGGRGDRCPTRCPGCKLGELVPVSGGLKSVEVAPGCVYQVAASWRHCPVCERDLQSREEEKSAEAAAYARHRLVVLERDGWTCQRCGRSGVPLQVAHKVGLSRARNPGKSKHALENLEACCERCHGVEHGW